jgi:hypothetical protein
LQSAWIDLNGIPIQLTRKKVRNFILKVAAPGKVSVSIPWRAPQIEVRTWLLSKIDWIEQQRALYAAQPSIVEPEYQTGENHWVQGQCCQLLVSHADKVYIQHDAANQQLQLQLPAYFSISQRAQLLEHWHRQQLSDCLPDLIQHWQAVIGVSVNEWRIRKMRTRWGSCNIQDKRIWFNLELAKKSLACVEYIVVHELVHLHERYHNARFYAYMDRFLPNWRQHKQQLNYG